MAKAPSKPIGIDLMGCDLAPRQLCTLLAESARDHSFLCFVENSLSGELAQEFPALSFAACSASIELEEDPLMALRRKGASSMASGLRAVAEGRCSALLSLGNTGALFAWASHLLPIFPGIQRPALLALLPSRKGEVALLDVGAQISYKAERLLDCARLGVLYQRALRGVETPRVGLLNIGGEAMKGTQELRRAYRLLSSDPHFVGNIEGREFFEGKADVVVTDGFTGNIFLKASEGVAAFLGRGGAEPAAAGALLIGVEGLVVKCHSGAAREGFRGGVQQVLQLVQQDSLARLTQNAK